MGCTVASAAVLTRCCPCALSLHVGQQSAIGDVESTREQVSSCPLPCERSALLMTHGSCTLSDVHSSTAPDLAHGPAEPGLPLRGAKPPAEARRCLVRAELRLRSRRERLIGRVPDVV